MAAVSDASSPGSGDGEGVCERERGGEEEKEEEERSKESHQRAEAAAWGRDIWWGGATKQGREIKSREAEQFSTVSTYQPELDLNNQFNPQNLNLKQHFKQFLFSQSLRPTSFPVQKENYKGLIMLMTVTSR